MSNTVMKMHLVVHSRWRCENESKISFIGNNVEGVFLSRSGIFLFLRSFYVLVHSSFRLPFCFNVILAFDAGFYEMSIENILVFFIRGLTEMME